MGTLRAAVGGLIALLLVISCNSSPAPTVELSQNTTQTISGSIQSVTPTDTAGSFVVAIKSNNGTQNVTVSKNTSIAIEGQACTLDQVDLYNLQGTSYNCTVVINPCDGKATQFDVVKIFP